MNDLRHFYILTDILLLADVFVSMWKTSYEKYTLKLSKLVSISGYTCAWVCLKQRIENLKPEDFFLLLDKIYGGRISSEFPCRVFREGGKRVTLYINPISCFGLTMTQALSYGA